MRVSDHAKHIEQGCWWGAVALLLVVGLDWRRVDHLGVGRRPAVGRWAVPQSSLATSASIDSAADYVVAHDPFRFNHTPAAAAFIPGQEDAPQYVPPPPPPRPSIVVQGIVGSNAHWAAVLAITPGREGGVLVRSGDTLSLGTAGQTPVSATGPDAPTIRVLRVRRIGRDTVVLQGLDTTWTLTLRQAWP